MSDPVSVDSGWLLSAIGAAVATLSGAVGVLWRHVTSTAKRNEKQQEARLSDIGDKLERCEDLHAETTSTLLELTREVGEVKGHQSGVTELAQRALDTVRDAIIEKDRHPPAP